jgi:hypothetical protein
MFSGHPHNFRSKPLLLRRFAPPWRGSVKLDQKACQMLKKGLKEHPQPLKSDKSFQFFGIFWLNILDLSQSFVLQYIVVCNGSFSLEFLTQQDKGGRI